MHALIHRFHEARLVLLCTASLLSSAAFAQAAAAPAAEPLEVRIGHAGPVSGPIAALGKDEENGVRMALEELDSQGLEIGGRKLKWVLEAGDDAGNTGQAVVLARQFCEKTLAAVVGHLQSGTTLAAGDIYQQCGLPLVTPGASHPAITEPGNGSRFRVIADDKASVSALVARAAAQGVKSLAIVDDRSAYGQGLVALLEMAARDQGLQILSKQYIDDKVSDFAPMLKRIKELGPDALFFGGMDAQAAPLLRQMTRLAMTDMRFLGGDALCTVRLPDLAGKDSNLKKVLCAVGGSPLERMPGGLAWKQRYEQRFGNQYQNFSPYAYDATMVLAQAMLRADSIEPRVFVPYLRQTDHPGVTGRIAFTPQGELAEPQVTLYQYEQGTRKIVP
ncbi:branched-chain amino acid ABC transporter substrate-binding protein [Comamonas composti]|uniref:branched-chain amino acid ABC transporter substrate-binding protein n=1 Tax=Comamonas composti TaxID=408558 RepID=UPI00047AF74D|nr:branched-chain amino acid ABC transporter substrate-binding protein [Comamonas composti]